MVSREHWVFLFIVGLLAFNWPLLVIFRADLPYYIFGVWAALIAAAAVMSRRMGKGRMP